MALERKLQKIKYQACYVTIIEVMNLIEKIKIDERIRVTYD